MTYDSTGLTEVAAGREYLAFRLGTEEYAFDIQKVQEIRGFEPVTRIVTAPKYVKGVVNLRGSIVPILDLRMKLSIGTPTYDSSTVVIIAESAGRTIGFVVDGVTDVVRLTESQIQPAPDFGHVQAGAYITGLGTLGNRTLILANVDALSLGADA